MAAVLISSFLPHTALVVAAEGAKDKETPLTKAAAAGELQTVKTLIAKGADVQASRSGASMTPMGSGPET